MKKTFILIAIAAITFSFMNDEKMTGLNVGDTAPDFKAKNQHGNEVNLHKQLESGPVILVFYRGEWCPYCNKQLSALEDSIGLIKEKGAQLIAISPENSENIEKTIEKTKATYDVISDHSLSIMNAYKVSFQLDEETDAKYKKWGIDLTERNGSNGKNLPVPAVYIIGKDGKISYRYFDENYKNRPSVKVLLENL